MLSPDRIPSEEDAHHYDARIARRFIEVAGGFWRGETARMAWLLTGGVVAMVLVTIGVNLCINRWNGWFFNALEQKNAATLGTAALAFPLIVAGAAAVGVGMVLARETLQVRWREWLVRHLVQRWLRRDAYALLRKNGLEPANPEYRIADDTRMVVEPMVDFFIGLLNATLTAATFIGILWSFGGSLTIGAGAGGITIPAYLVLAAIIYGAVVSTLVVKVGRPLLHRVGLRNEAEARFRFEIMRIREDATAIAASNGAGDARRGLDGLYDGVVRRWLSIVRKHSHLAWVTNSNGVFVSVFPLFLCAPKYLAGEYTLGDVMMIVPAFVQVQIAISWLVDNFRFVAQAYASANRVVALADAVDATLGAETDNPEDLEMLSGPSIAPYPAA